MHLAANNIDDIDILEKVNFKELKKIKIDLYSNQISNINILEKVKFEKLEELNLLKNKIGVKQNNSIISKMKTILKI